MVKRRDTVLIPGLLMVDLDGGITSGGAFLKPGALNMKFGGRTS